MNGYFDKFVRKIKKIPDNKPKKSAITLAIGDKVNPKHMMTLFYFVALAARLVEVDGATNNKERAQLVKLFPNFLGAKIRIESLYRDAVQDQNDLEFFVSKIKAIYPRNKLLFRQIIDNLIILADADAPVNNHELGLIQKLAVRLGFAKKNVEKWLENYLLQNMGDDYKLLGLSYKTSKQDLNEAYREKMMKYHPDKLYSYPNIADIYLQACRQQYDAISKAYERLKDKI